MKVLLIIPAYNEALNIVKTVTDVTTHTDYDYIIINDCSKDNTKEVCEEHGFNVLNLPVNFGLTSGIQVGMKYAKAHDYDVAIQFDGDGQHDARYLKDLVDAIEKDECDIAIGSRFVTEKKPHSMRMLGSNIISFCIKLVTGKRINDPTSGMRAYDKEVIGMYVRDNSLTPEPDTLVAMMKNGHRVKEYQVTMRDREFGESYLNPIRAIEYMFNMTFAILFIRSTTKKGGK